MDNKPAKENDDESREFEQLSRERDRGLLVEFWDFLRDNNKWWLTPIFVVFMLMGILIWISASSTVAPFVYTLW